MAESFVYAWGLGFGLGNRQQEAILDSDLATQLVSACSTGPQNAIQTTLLKKANEADQAVVELVSQASRAPAPEGQGARIDKLA